MIEFKNSWDNIIKDEFQKEYYLNLRKFLALEYKHFTVYPDMANIFQALKSTSYEDVKVVILGQDPYHGPNQGHGLAFSVMPGISSPPSLINIFKEIVDDVGGFIPNNGNLTSWTNQGILLLNTVLTVRSGIPNSHKNRGWEIFTDKIINKLSEREKPIVFLLWGNYAKEKLKLIANHHYVLTAPHPSPFSARYGFFGCKHFSQTNDILKKQGFTEINWQILDINDNI